MQGHNHAGAFRYTISCEPQMNVPRRTEARRYSLYVHYGGVHVGIQD